MAHGESAWNILGHEAHQMSNGLPVAFAALAALMVLFLPRIAPVVRWTVRWTLWITLIAIATGINAAGGITEALEEVVGDITLGRHAILATLFLITLLVGVALGRKNRDRHELSPGERWVVLGGFLMVAATGWFGGEHALHEEREEGGLASASPAGAVALPENSAMPVPDPEEAGHDHAPGTPEHDDG